jgi:capsular polysaccharide export protein
VVSLPPGQRGRPVAGGEGEKQALRRYASASHGVARQSGLGAFLDGSIVRHRRGISAETYDGVVAWGRKPSASRAEGLAQRWGLPLIRLEDGFLRSYGTGDRFPALALVVDEEGIYYDGTRASSLERLLDSAADVLADLKDDVARARALILTHRLSKYNHAPAWEAGPHPFAGLRPREGEGKGVVERVLVIDQTAGDMSVLLGGASARTFADMLAAARAENPHAVIYVKTHPEVSAGRKGGYLTDVQDDAHTVVLRQNVNPLSLIEQMDRVYAVSSTMGFEALLAGKPVTVFGMPWYAGWGATDDRQRCARRTRRRSVDELFAAAYFHYTRYLDPVTHRRGTIFDVIDWLLRQRAMSAKFIDPADTGRMLCVGFRRWKAANLRPLLGLQPDRVLFVRDARAALRLAPGPKDCLVHWGRAAPAGVAELADRSGARVLRMEDGFIRSVGLGSDLIAPMSLVLDPRGIYFDPGQPSELEVLLNKAVFDATDRARAQAVRRFIVAEGITKYNTEPRQAAGWAVRARPGQRIVLVPGQVEDDASIRFGCDGIRTNLGLLAAARAAEPDAFIVYKPHPDVMASNRRGAVALASARQFADHVEAELSVVSCIEACDAVHTMTSLTGFDALLRGKHVVVYGRPFYAGWGLTEDRLPMPRRERQLDLDGLVAGALLHYPLYWDETLKGYTSCEAVLRRLVETRAEFETSGEPGQLKLGYLRRQWRKLEVLARNWRG